jgi:DeoR family fructose operon transcriptional repressor
MVIPAERKRQILERIRTEASVKVADLARKFNVSESTIRRDLNELQKADLLERSYGGAVVNFVVNEKEEEATFMERQVSHQGEKCRIAEVAVRYIKSDETILIDGGTTAECLANYLGDIPRLTVVTYGLNIVAALAGRKKNITVIGVGGILQHDARFFGGVLAIDALNVYNIRFDKAFIGASAISAETGITNFGFEEIGIKRKAIELSREVILLADSTKIGKSAPGFVAPATAIQRLVTDQGAPEEELERLRSLGIIVEVA